jgi:hypothetical protein
MFMAPLIRFPLEHAVFDAFSPISGLPEIGFI